MNDYSIYVLQSEKDNRLYVGMSSNIARRFQEHNLGYVFSTKGYLPWKLVYQEFIGTRVHAREREKYLKSGSGKEFLKKMLLNK